MAETGEPTTVGAYDILGFLGHGGMATVYRARHRNPQLRQRQGGDVAIKVMHVAHARDPAFRQRFEREAELGLELNHPNIIKALDLVIDGPYLAFVMELVNGYPLSQSIGEKAGPIPWEQAWPVFAQILDAVEYAHLNQVVHRDLKPSNFLVGPDGRVKVGDFGVARRGDSDLTQVGTSVGTVTYMAPEQVTDAANVDHRADIYGLGMVLYVILTGRLPWPGGDSDYKVLTIKTSTELPSPRTFCKTIPANVSDAVLKAIAIRPEARFDSVRSFRNALQGQPVRTVLPPLPKAPEPTPLPRHTSEEPTPAPVPAPSRKGFTGCQVALVAAALMAMIVILVVAGIFFLRPKLAPVTTVSKSAVEPPSGGAVARIRARGTLLWGTDTGTPTGVGSPPMYFPKEDGSPDGFDYVVARRIADALGVPNISVVHGLYSELPGKLADPAVLDLVIAGFIPYTEPGIAWSDPYLEFGLCMVVPRSSRIHTTRDLWGRAIGIYDDPAAAQEVNHLVKGYTNLVRMEDGYWDAMLAGKFDAFIYDYPFAKAEIDNYYRDNPKRRNSLRIAQYNLTDSTYAVMVRDSEPDLLAVVNGAIRDFRASPAYAEAIRTYLGGDEAAEAPAAPTGRSHRVQKGETLGTIAAAELGDATRWEEIWKLNKDRFPNPHLILVDDELVLP